MPPDPTITAILESVPATFRGPGGAVAVVKDGDLAAQHVWGFADLDARVSIEPATIFPICSISKQMVCLVLTELLEHDKDKAFEEAFNKALHEILPAEIMANKDFTIDQLVGMRSGLRDYWILSVLWGATPQGRFSIYSDAPKALKRLAGFHFAPGTQMSYSNTNFMAVGLAMERATGKTLGELLDESLFVPARMKTAAMRADTERTPLPIIGYEGSEETGYIPYKNRIEWAGDAGVQASLGDMIAYEKYIDSAAKDPQSAYSKNAQQPHYIDGTPASYGHGLVHNHVDGIKVIGHSGGLAGFRLFRVYAAEIRTSIVVLRNSEQTVEDVAVYIMRKLIGKEKEEDVLDEKLKIDWAGHYFDDDLNLVVSITQDKPGEIVIDQTGMGGEKIKLTSATTALSKGLELNYEGGKLTMHRRLQGRTYTARPLGTIEEASATPTYTGTYRSEAIDSTLHCVGTGDMMYGYFDGYLGKGPAHLMKHVGRDVWTLACNRSLDAPPPGNWTLLFHREGGHVCGVTVGCWGARGIRFNSSQSMSLR